MRRPRSRKARERVLRRLLRRAGRVQGGWCVRCGVRPRVKRRKHCLGCLAERGQRRERNVCVAAVVLVPCAPMWTLWNEAPPVHLLRPDRAAHLLRKWRE